MIAAPVSVVDVFSTKSPQTREMILPQTREMILESEKFDSARTQRMCQSSARPCLSPHKEFGERLHWPSRSLDVQGVCRGIEVPGVQSWCLFWNVRPSTCGVVLELVLNGMKAQWCACDPQLPFKLTRADLMSGALVSITLHGAEATTLKRTDFVGRRHPTRSLEGLVWS